MSLIPSPLRITCVRDHLLPSGGTDEIFRLLTFIDPSRVAFKLIVLRDFSVDSQRFISAGVSVKHCKKKWQLHGHLMQQLPHRILLSGPKAQIWGALLARYKRLPVTVFFNHMLPTGPIRLAIQKILSRKSDRAITVSNSVAEQVVARYGIPIEQVDVVYPGIELEKFQPAPSVLEHDLEKPLISVIGRIRFSEKGQDVMLDAWPAILKKYPKAQLQFIGDGVDMNRLKEQVSGNAALIDSVSLLGQQDNIASYIRKSSLIVAPSLCFEGFPLVMLEAAAVGRASVAFASGGLSEVIVDGKTGLLVPPGNENALVKAILRLLADPQLLSTLCAAGPAHAANFSIKRQVSNFALALEQTPLS